MYLNSDWRILTIGDGDFSFSLALMQTVKPRHLTATAYDSLAEISEKYGDQHYQDLRALQCDVLTGFDVTCPDSWQGLSLNQFDAVIFQFPLMPGFRSKEEFIEKAAGASTNLLNRRLLRQYLVHCERFFLDPEGAGLAIITSKDVKPYREWNLEYSLAINTGMHYLGYLSFQSDEFPGYKVRNVDRDKHVKDTKGLSYYWSPNQSHQLKASLNYPGWLQHGLQAGDYCALCRTGPFASDRDAREHLLSRRHKVLQQYEDDWRQDCASESDSGESSQLTAP